MSLNPETVRRLERIAVDMRMNILEMAGVGRASHIGGSASIVEIVTALYFHQMRKSLPGTEEPDADVFILSKGHGALAQYAALVELGIIPREEMYRIKTVGGILQGHPDKSTPGIEASTGSLGQGLSVGLGIALGLRLDGRKGRVYVIMGDGEMAEGQIWEAAMAASRFKVANLIAILDKNGIQATGRTSDVFEIPDLSRKWDAFGWHVMEADGHSFPEIMQTLEEATRVTGRPILIVMRTLKGKGFSFAEDTANFHNAALTEEQYRSARLELQEVRKRLDA